MTPPLVDFACVAAHADADYLSRAGSTITVFEKLWAYCIDGAIENHAWERVRSSTVDEVRRVALTRRVSQRARVLGSPHTIKP